MLWIPRAVRTPIKAVCFHFLFGMCAQNLRINERECVCGNGPGCGWWRAPNGGRRDGRTESSATGNKGWRLHKTIWIPNSMHIIITIWAERFAVCVRAIRSLVNEFATHSRCASPTHDRTQPRDKRHFCRRYFRISVRLFLHIHWTVSMLETWILHQANAFVNLWKMMSKGNLL